MFIHWTNSALARGGGLFGCFRYQIAGSYGRHWTGMLSSSLLFFVFLLATCYYGGLTFQGRRTKEMRMMLTGVRSRQCMRLPRQLRAQLSHFQTVSIRHLRHKHSAGAWPGTDTKNFLHHVTVGVNEKISCAALFLVQGRKMPTTLK